MIILLQIQLASCSCLSNWGVNCWRSAVHYGSSYLRHSFPVYLQTTAKYSPWFHFIFIIWHIFINYSRKQPTACKYQEENGEKRCKRPTRDCSRRQQDVNDNLQAKFPSECEAIERLSDHWYSHSNQRTSITGHHFASHHRHLTVHAPTTHTSRRK